MPLAGDPLGIGFRAGAAGLGALGQGVQQAAGAFAKSKEKQDKATTDLVLQLVNAGQLRQASPGETPVFSLGNIGLVKTEPPSLELRPGERIKGFKIDPKTGQRIPEIEVLTAQERVKEQEAQELLTQAGLGGPTPSPFEFPVDVARGEVRLPTGKIATQEGLQGGILAAKMRAKKFELQTETQIKARGEILKLSEKARVNFGRSVSMFKNVVAQVKGAAIEQRRATKRLGVETTGMGLLPGIVGQFGAFTKRPGFGRVAAAYGQTTETALALNSILTGQNRVIRSVVSMIFATLPGPRDPEDQVAAKLTQSIINSYKLVKSFEKGGLTPEALKKLTDEQLEDIDAKSLVAIYTLTPTEEKELKSIIDDVLSTPAREEAKLLGDEFGEASILSDKELERIAGGQ